MSAIFGKMNRFIYEYAKLRNIGWCIIRKVIGVRNFKRHRYYGKQIKGIDDANQIIYRKIISGKPFLAARYGDAELRTLVYTLDIDFKFRSSFPQYIKTAMSRNAGFFPTDDESLLRFGHLLWKSSEQVDLFGVWYNLLEDYMIHYTAPTAELVELEALEPYRSSQPWSRALKGKKVLVVHPFKDSIEHQFLVKEKLFENQDVLPDFDLITYKAIQTNAGGKCDYPTWFDALNKMYQDIQQLDFDLAIVGCGAYGLPLSAKIKAMGKQAIHLAGATQIMFGIRGARWDARAEMQKFFNENWIRPSEAERPKDAQSVEGACYW